MVAHREMEEEDNHQQVVFLVRLDMNLRKPKKVLIKSISLTDKPFKINKILSVKIMTVNLFHKIHRKNQEVEYLKTDPKMQLKIQDIMLELRYPKKSPQHQLTHLFSQDKLAKNSITVSRNLPLPPKQVIHQRTQIKQIKILSQYFLIQVNTVEPISSLLLMAMV